MSYSLCHPVIVRIAPTNSILLRIEVGLTLYYFAPVGVRSIVINPSVCLSVRPRAYLWNRWTDLHEIFCAYFL